MEQIQKEEDGYDPVQEAIEKKHNIKPPTDLNVKKAKYLNSPQLSKLQKIALVMMKFEDIITKACVDNVYVKVTDEVNNKIYSYRSNEKGICKVMLKQRSKFYV